MFMLMIECMTCALATIAPVVKPNIKCNPNPNPNPNPNANLNPYPTPYEFLVHPFPGDYCEVDIDLCHPMVDPCQNGGVCFDLGHSYR